MRVATRRTFMSPMNGDTAKGQQALKDMLRSEPARSFPYLVTSAGTDKDQQGFGTWIRLPTDDFRYDDLMIVAHRETAGSGSFTWPTGWTELADSNADGSVDCATIGWRRVTFDSNESEHVTLSYSTSNDAGVSVCLLIRNAGTPVISSVVSANTSTPDPPNLAPGLGSLDFLWIALATGEARRTVNSYPTNYNQDQGFVAGGVANGNVAATIAWATRQLNASSENPGTFSLSSAEDTMSWTLAIPPA